MCSENLRITYTSKHALSRLSYFQDVRPQDVRCPSSDEKRVRVRKNNKKTSKDLVTCFGHRKIGKEQRL